MDENSRKSIGYLCLTLVFFTLIIAMCTMQGQVNRTQRVKACFENKQPAVLCKYFDSELVPPVEGK